MQIYLIRLGDCNEIVICNKGFEQVDGDEIDRCW